MKTKPSMNRATYRYRTQQLVNEIMQHPHKDELLNLCHDQLQDDADMYAATALTANGSQI
tara:strand:- start:1342 stop:1521 length:180 start_codon:yes stop_codon:yes gene_type:complete